MAKKDEARQDVVEAGAGAPDGLREAAEALPEGDDVETAVKEGMTADSTGEEAKAKAEVVELSPDSADTPSGYALKETAGIGDPVERGEEYARSQDSQAVGHRSCRRQEVAMATRNAGRVFAAREPLSATVDGVPIYLDKGDLIDENDPVRTGREDMFEPFVPTVRKYDRPNEIEQATAAPGEKRNR
jgi:hypothetical protein